MALTSTFPLAGLAREWILAPGPSLCAYRSLVGLPCCFCGLTRSFSHVAHGDLAAATASNPWWPLAVAVVAGLSISLVLAGLLGRDLPAFLGRWWRHWWWATLVVVVLATATRHLTGW